MITTIGKFLRMYRMEHDMLLKEMADGLGLTSAYLSAIENGKRNPTEEFVKKVKEAYKFKEKEEQDLMNSYFQTINSITIDTSDSSQDQTDLGLVFARKINHLSNEDIKQILEIINK